MRADPSENPLTAVVINTDLHLEFITRSAETLGVSYSEAKEKI